MMVFNPLFLQNTAAGLENIHPEKVNKLNGSGYLFSDIINVFMNTDENDSLTKLTQEFLGSAQIKESNGTPVILSLLGESLISAADLTKDLQLKIEDFLPAGLKKKLVKLESENNKNVIEKSLSVNQNQLEQVLKTINNLLGIGKPAENNNTGNTGVDLTAATELLEESDGIFLIVETTDKVFNINISKQTDGKTSDLSNANDKSENLYKIKFTLINETSLLNSQGSGELAVNKTQNESQLSFLPFESELAEENINNNPSVKLKVFTYQNLGGENVLANVPKNKLNFVNSLVKTEASGSTAGNSAGVNSNLSKNTSGQNIPVQETEKANSASIVKTGDGINETVKVPTNGTETTKSVQVNTIVSKGSKEAPAESVEAKTATIKTEQNKTPELNKVSEQVKNPEQSKASDQIKTPEQGKVADQKITNTVKSTEHVSDNEIKPKAELNKAPEVNKVSEQVKNPEQSKASDQIKTPGESKAADQKIINTVKSTEQVSDNEIKPKSEQNKVPELNKVTEQVKNPEQSKASDQIKTPGQSKAADQKITNTVKSTEHVSDNEIKLKAEQNKVSENITSKQFKEENTIVKNEVKHAELKTESLPKIQAKENTEPLTKNELKESSEYKPGIKKDVFNQVGETQFEKTSKERNDDNTREFNSNQSRHIEKFVQENKENEQLNIKVAKAVKNITTVKPENTQLQNIEKPVKENLETKTNTTEEKTGNVKPAESSEKNFSQSENSFKQSEENKHIPLDSNKINSTQAKEKFTLDAPVPNSNSERIVKVAEIMKEISKFIEKQDKSTLTIRVSPEELGKLKITLDITEQNVKANIHVENEAVKTIIEKNIIELQNQMSKSGIQLTSVNVSLAEGEQKTAKQFVNKKKSNSPGMDDKNLDEKDEEKIKMMGYNTVEYLA